MGLIRTLMRSELSLILSLMANLTSTASSSKRFAANEMFRSTTRTRMRNSHVILTSMTRKDPEGEEGSDDDDSMNVSQGELTKLVEDLQLAPDLKKRKLKKKKIAASGNAEDGKSNKGGEAEVVDTENKENAVA